MLCLLNVFVRPSRFGGCNLWREVSSASVLCLSSLLLDTSPLLCGDFFLCFFILSALIYTRDQYLYSMAPFRLYELSMSPFICLMTHKGSVNK